MLIKENELRIYIKKLLKENESDTAIAINDTTTFDISKQINTALTDTIHIDTVQKIIDILTKVQNIFNSQITKKISDPNKKVVLSSTSCSYCKKLYEKEKDNIIYINIDDDLSNPDIETSYTVYQQLFNYFKEMWKSFTITNTSDYYLETLKQQSNAELSDKYDATKFLEHWTQILQVCSLLNASKNMKNSTEIMIGYPKVFNSYTEFIGAFDTAIKYLNKIQNTLNKPKKTSLREIKIKISKTLFEIYNYCKEKKSYLKFFEFLRKFAAQYSENDDVENIIEVFEKSLSDKVINLTVKNFYNVNSFIFQHRSKEEKKAWLKFISWLRKRYKML